MIPLLTTTVVSLSLRSLVCYQINSTDNRLLAGRARIFLTFAARSNSLLSFISAKIKGAASGCDTHATFGQCERLANFDELFSSYRRKSFTMDLPLRTKFLSGA